MSSCSPAKAGAQYLLPSPAGRRRLGSCLRRGAALLISLSLTACTAVQLPAGPAPLDPIAFFTGTSQGTGTLRPIVGKATRVTVTSQGTPTADGLRLVQRIREGTKPERVRIWTIRRLPGGYLSTLTDAEGMVTVDTTGPRAFIAYTTPSGIRIRQQLALQPDGRTVLNHLEAFKYGIRVATLDETIRR